MGKGESKEEQLPPGLSFVFLVAVFASLLLRECYWQSRASAVPSRTQTEYSPVAGLSWNTPKP